MLETDFDSPNSLLPKGLLLTLTSALGHLFYPIKEQKAEKLVQPVENQVHVWDL